MVAQENAAVKPQPSARYDAIREKKSDFLGMPSSAVEQAPADGGICDEKLAYWVRKSTYKARVTT